MVFHRPKSPMKRDYSSDEDNDGGNDHDHDDGDSKHNDGYVYHIGRTIDRYHPTLEVPRLPLSGLGVIDDDEPSTTASLPVSSQSTPTPSGCIIITSKLKVTVMASDCMGIIVDHQRACTSITQSS